MKIKVPLKKSRAQQSKVEVVTTGKKPAPEDEDKPMPLKKLKPNTQVEDPDGVDGVKTVNAFSILKESSKAYYKALNHSKTSTKDALTTSNRKRKYESITQSKEESVINESSEMKIKKAFKVKDEAKSEVVKEEAKSEVVKEEAKSEVIICEEGALKSYSFEFKKQFIETVNRHGLNNTCILKNVSLHTAKHWVSNFKKEGIEGLKDKRVNNHPPINKLLDDYIVDQIRLRRKDGLIVNCRIIQSIALQSAFHIRPLTFKCSDGFISRFLKRNKLVRRKKTHVIQKWVSSTVEDIGKYFNTLYTLSDSDKDKKITYINIDEVPIYFDMSPDYTYHFKGAKEVSLLSHSKNKVRMSLLMAISSDGIILSPMMLFVYKYAGKKTRDYPKKFEKFRNVTKPWMLKFNESGFTTSSLIIEYIQKIISKQATPGKKFSLWIQQVPIFIKKSRMN